MKKILVALSMILPTLAAAAPARILIIRHAEKPSDEKSDDLSQKGYARAQALTQLFEVHPELATNGLPVAYYASAYVPGESANRAIETITPLAKKYNLPVQSPFLPKDAKKLAKAILKDASLSGKTVMIAWTHKMLPALAEALGVDSPPEWDGAVFDRIWVLDYTAGKVTFKDIPQNILPGDSVGIKNPPQAFEGYFIYDRKWLSTLSRQSPLIVDHVSAYGFELYGPPGLGAWLQKSGIRSAPLVHISQEALNDYPAPEDIGPELQALVQKYPHLAKVYSIGKSAKGRDLWVIKISKNVAVDDNRPEFKYIANMHGDEIVGREMMVLLAQDLLQNYGTDPVITELVDHLQISIMPSMNPDGAAAGRRFTATNVDLNRDFPDWSTSDNQDVPTGRAVETQAVMHWEASHHFVLSANFHGGAEVVNYPWDAVEQLHPLNDLVKSLSLDYAKQVPYIFASTYFENGITNGWAWYEVKGGMQDWSWYYHRDLQLTIELSQTKWPAFSDVNTFYQANRPALLSFIRKAETIHQSLL